MIVGIDLGTTFSAAATLNSAGVPHLVPDRSDTKQFHTPSVVCIQENRALVGDRVEAMLRRDPGVPVCRFAKKSMGTDKIVYTDALGRSYQAHAISSIILRKIRRDLEESLGGLPEAVVISVPANFNESQRSRTVDAGRLAGLPIAGLVEEPVAAAAFCATTAGRRGEERTIMVFDLGGGTLDTTILCSTPDGLYVLATEGADDLGGKNFDDIVIDLIERQYRACHGRGLSEDVATMQAVRIAATECKLELAQQGVTQVHKPLLLDGRPLQFAISRSQFETAAEAWLDAAVHVCERALAAAKFRWSSLDEILLTGGSSQLPCVERRLREASGFSMDRMKRHQPRAAVAYGVALLAAGICGDHPSIAPPLRQSVSTNEVGLRLRDPRTGRAQFHPIVPKNVRLPVLQKKQLYADTTSSDTVSILVQQRKDEFTAEETLGSFSFGPLAPGRANLQVEAELGYDEAGRIQVRVRDLDSGKLLDEIVQKGDSDLAELHAWLSEVRLH